MHWSEEFDENSNPMNSLQSDFNENEARSERKERKPREPRGPREPRESREPRKRARMEDTSQPEVKHFANFFGREKIKAECRIITESRFEINVPYDQRLIEFFKTIRSGVYEKETKLWNFHIDDYPKTINDMKSQFHKDVDVSEIPQIALQMFKDNFDKGTEFVVPDLSKIDPVLVSKLKPFQRDGILFAIKKNGRCMIADDMGLGKTIQALGVAHYFKDSWPLLIVTPSSVRYQWSESIYQFLPSVQKKDVFHYSSKNDYLGKQKITITSYDLMSDNIKLFERKNFGFVIFDESHMLKNPETERTKAAKKLVKAPDHILLLSGTPALSRPMELYTQILLINRNFMDYDDYGLRYCGKKKRGRFGSEYLGNKNTHELGLLLKSCYFTRRMKSDVLTELPDKIRQVVMLDPKLLEAGTKEMEKMAEDLKGGILSGFKKQNTLTKYYSDSSKQRLKAVGNYVEDLVKQNKKFLIFAYHKCLLDKISNVLDKLCVKYVRIDGKVSPAMKKKRVDEFQKIKDCMVAVLSIKATNTGITLTAASLVIFAELYWNPADLIQAEDRVHRIGQRDCVTIQYLIARGSVDDYIWPMLETKTGFLRDAGLDQNFSLSRAAVLKQSSSNNDTCNEKTRESGNTDDNDFVVLLEDDDENSENINPDDDDDSVVLLDDHDEDVGKMDLDDVIWI